jgi:hypothetical protein
MTTMAQDEPITAAKFLICTVSSSPFQMIAGFRGMVLRPWKKPAPNCAGRPLMLYRPGVQQWQNALSPPFRPLAS